MRLKSGDVNCIKKATGALLFHRETEGSFIAIIENAGYDAL